MELTKVAEIKEAYSHLEGFELYDKLEEGLQFTENNGMYIADNEVQFHNTGTLLMSLLMALDQLCEVYIDGSDVTGEINSNSRKVNIIKAGPAINELDLNAVIELTVYDFDGLEIFFPCVTYLSIYQNDLDKVSKHVNCDKILWINFIDEEVHVTKGELQVRFANVLYMSFSGKIITPELIKPTKYDAMINYKNLSKMMAYW